MVFVADAAEFDAVVPGAPVEVTAGAPAGAPVGVPVGALVGVPAGAPVAVAVHLVGQCGAEELGARVSPVEVGVQGGVNAEVGSVEPQSSEDSHSEMMLPLKSCRCCLLVTGSVN